MPPVIDDKYYLNLYNEKSRWGMTSGNRTPVADQGSGGHSVFAYQLLKELKQNEKPYISTQEIYTRIAPIVGNNSEQTPLCRPIRNTGDQGGEFVFVASSGANIEKVPLPGSGRVAAAPAKTDDTGLSAERERLEQERNELEKIKADAAERKRIEEDRLRIEAEKKQIATPRPATPSSLSGSGEKEIASDGTLKEWQEFTSPECKFSVLMPDKPKEQTSTTQTANGTVNHHGFMHDTGSSVYMVVYTEIPEKGMGDPKKMLDIACGSAEKRLKGKIVSEKEISLGNNKGRELTIQVPSEKIPGGRMVKLRMYMVENRLYQVWGMVNGSKLTESVDKFHNSFKLL
jgi:hypothetical protein